MLIVCSPTYGMTKWTFRELQMADNNHKKLVRLAQPAFSHRWALAAWMKFVAWPM